MSHPLKKYVATTLPVVKATWPGVLHFSLNFLFTSLTFSVQGLLLSQGAEWKIHTENQQSGKYRLKMAYFG